MSTPSNVPPPLPVQPLPYAHASEQRHRITMALVCLHISAVLYLIVAAGICMFPHMDLASQIIICVVCAGLIVGIEIVAWGLTRRYYWAWIAGIVIFAIYAPSAFFILGGFGLWGLLDPGSRAQFRQ